MNAEWLTTAAQATQLRRRGAPPPRQSRDARRRSSGWSSQRSSLDAVDPTDRLSAYESIDELAQLVDPSAPMPDRHSSRPRCAPVTSPRSARAIAREAERRGE